MISSLQQIKLFHGLTALEEAYIRTKLQEHPFSTGEILCREQELGNRLFLLFSGSVEVTKSGNDGRTYRICTLNSGDSFGEMTLVDIQPRSASVIALSAGISAVLPYKSVLEILEEDPALYTKILLNITREFSRRLRSMNDGFVEFLQLSPEKLKELDS